MLSSILAYLVNRAASPTAPVESAEDPDGAVPGSTEAVVTPNGKLNVVPGFLPSVGDLREVHRLMAQMGVPYTMLGDHGDVFDAPANGDYDLYPGGTSLADAADAVNALGTVFLQADSTKRTAELVRDKWKQPETTVGLPIGVKATDRFVTGVAELAGVPVPAEVTVDRGRLLDAMADSYAYLHGKRVALAGDPDLVLGLLSFLLELGVVPVHVLSTTGTKDFEAAAQALLATSEFGQSATVWAGKDLWHLRSLVFTEPVDLLIGNTFLKQLSREANVPLVRVGFPIFDRHHLHRFPIVGYGGGIVLLSQLVNTVLDELDRAAPDHSFDLVR
jgi:nitrogenase molybdenum-iron protein beta chain